LFWFVVCSRCEAYKHCSWFGYRWNAYELRWFVTGGMLVSVGQFSYRCDSCELVALGYSWVTLVQFMLTSCLGLGAILCN
jgi:hypothetical protein